MKTLDRPIPRQRDIHWQLRSFFEFHRSTGTELRHVAQVSVPVYENEFWTAKQRHGHSLHEISYRACYKPQLPDFFIQRFCKAGDVVYDPFMGRGTTLVQAQLRDCAAIGSDLNPLSSILVKGRLGPPSLAEVEDRLRTVKLTPRPKLWKDLLVFFHPKTLAEICGWKEYFAERNQEGTFDRVDAWMQMVCCNRLTGHSPGFFSVYTLPPNLAASLSSQVRINQKRGQQPEYRDTRALILRKTRGLLADPLPSRYAVRRATLHCSSADATPGIADSSVRLIVTSPPFLDTVNYEQDNWMRMWFGDVELKPGALWQCRSLDDWLTKMTACFHEFRRILQDDGVIAFEVGEIRKGVLRLENEVMKAALAANLITECVMINSQSFTKTANCWGVKNNHHGTNTNRIVILRKRRL
ncbi:MAG: hypothetical protein QOD99_2753 [Chthoniobacter sp.]|nr:hypothetical protein [Chthoniobacter sp.]